MILKNEILRTKTIIKTVVRCLLILMVIIACDKKEETDVIEEEEDNSPKIVGCNSVEYDGYVFNDIGCSPGIACFNIQISENGHYAEFNIMCSNFGCISYVALPDEDTMNYPPTLHVIGDQTVAYVNTKNVVLGVSDLNLEPHTYNIEPDFDFVSIEDNVLVINPEEKDIGSYDVTVTASDGSGGTDSEDFTINIVRYIWEFITIGDIESSPAIGSDSTVYINTGISLIAINPDGMEKWEFDEYMNDYSSPVVGSDGTIYACSYNSLFAVNPDGTLKWECETVEIYESTPAIGSD
jgi:hypothetical protein